LRISRPPAGVPALRDAFATAKFDDGPTMSLKSSVLKPLVCFTGTDAGHHNTGVFCPLSISSDEIKVGEPIGPMTACIKTDGRIRSASTTPDRDVFLTLIAGFILLTVNRVCPSWSATCATRACGWMVVQSTIRGFLRHQRSQRSTLCASRVSSKRVS